MEKVPTFLYDLLIKQYGEDLTKKIINGYSKKRITSFRVNNLKTNNKEIQKFLDDNNIKYNKVSWYDDAFIVTDIMEIDIKNLNMYEEGKIYLQSLSSMLPVLVLNPNKEIILDMSAAPGSKTTQIASITHNQSLITAVEKNKIRCDRLKYNITKQGAKATVLMEDARYLDDFFSFDKILLDAPCSGSGTLYLENIDNFSLDLINRSQKLQYELLEKAIKLLKVGGTLIYSTCSILKEENEENINKILNNNNIEIVKIEKDLFKDIPLLPTTIDGVVCVMPTKYYEGFFIAKLRKVK